MGLVELLADKVGFTEAFRIANLLEDVADRRWWCEVAEKYTGGPSSSGKFCLTEAEGKSRHSVAKYGCGWRIVLTL